MNVSKQTIKKLKLGNEDAFDEIYYAYNRLIFFILYSIVKQRENAEDLMQEAFIKMYNNIHTLKDNSKFHYWFIRLSKNIALNYIKKQTAVLVDIDDMTYCSEQMIHNDSRVIDEFKGYLTDIEYQIIILKIVHNLTFLQIADMHNKRIGQITRLYYSGIKKIKNLFNKGAEFIETKN